MSRSLIDGFEVAPKSHIAVKDRDLVYFGPYERRSDYAVKSNGEKAPLGCEWVTGFNGRTVAYLTDTYSVIIYTPVDTKTKEIKEEIKEDKSGCPEGYELAPADHVLVANVDLLKYSLGANSIIVKCNVEGKSPPLGYEWVKEFGGSTVINKIFSYGYYSAAYRPITKKVIEVEKPTDKTDKVDKVDKVEIKPLAPFESLLFIEKCKHTNYKHFEWNGTGWNNKWCRKCGALWTRSGRKWVSPKK
jgi:hypothetical protein